MKRKIALENHPNDSRFGYSSNNIVQTLNGRMGTGGGNTPMVMEVECARTQNPILRILQETYGTEAVFNWGIDVLVALQQAKVLQQRVYDEGVQEQNEDREKLGDGSLPRPKLVALWCLRDVWGKTERGCAPQGQESTEQLDKQFAKVVSELPQQSPQASKALFDMWRKGEGIWILQQALYTIQEIRKPIMGEWKGGDGMMGKAVVRRLTPL